MLVDGIQDGKHYNAKLRSWEKLPKVWYPQCEDHRKVNQHPGPTSMLPQQSKVKHRRAITVQKHSSDASSSLEVKGLSREQGDAKNPTASVKTPVRCC